MEENEHRQVLRPRDFHEALEGVAYAAYSGVRVIELNLEKWANHENDDLERLLYIARRKDMSTIVKNYSQLMAIPVCSPRV